MNVSGYTTQDLKALNAALDAAMAEAVERNLDLPLPLMTRRLFDAARWGERDTARLKAEVLGDSLHLALARGSRADGGVVLGQGYNVSPSSTWASRASVAFAAR